jgi:hypothetical protein
LQAAAARRAAVVRGRFGFQLGGLTLSSVPEEAHSLPIKRSHQGAMFKKIVQRVPVAAYPVSEPDCSDDLIEIELGLSTGGQSVRNRLSEVVSEIRRSEGVASRESVTVLLDVIERLKKIEGLLSDNGFETGSESP